MTEATSLPPSAFRGRRARFTHTQTFRGSIGEVFPLLCPVREYEYLPAWTCEIIYLESDLVEAGGVFITDRPGDGGRDVWVVAQYVPNEAIQFVRTNRLRTMTYSVQARSDGPGAVQLVWEQVVTGLNDEGNRLVDSLSQDEFARRLSAMEKRLQHYLETGQMMRHAPEPL